MAYEQIYQITTKPLSVEEYITEHEFIDDTVFIGNISDGVSGRDIDRNEEIQNFREWLTEKEVALFNDDDSFFIMLGGKEKYFETAYIRFLEAVKKAVNITHKEFAGGTDCAELVRQISVNFCEKFSPYISSDEFCTIPLDKFIREAEIGKRYYINGILHYHW